MDNVPAFLGTLPGWITASGVTGILWIVAHWQLGVRKVAVEAQQVRVNAAQVEHVDEADIRDHYADEVRQLRERLDAQAERHVRRESDIEERYRKLLREADERHEACQDANKDLREEVERVKEELGGLRRQILRYSADGVILLEHDPTGAPSQEVVAAAERVIAMHQLTQQET